MTPVYHLKINAVFSFFLSFRYVPVLVKFKLSSYAKNLHDNSDNLSKVRYRLVCLPHDADKSRVPCQNSKRHNSYDVLFAWAVSARLILLSFIFVFQYSAYVGPVTNISKRRVNCYNQHFIRLLLLYLSLLLAATQNKILARTRTAMSMPTGKRFHPDLDGCLVETSKCLNQKVCQKTPQKASITRHTTGEYFAAQGDKPYFFNRYTGSRKIFINIHEQN